MNLFSTSPWLIGLTLLVFSAQAQTQQHERCGQQHALEKLYARQPEARASVEAAERAVEAYLQQYPETAARQQEDVVYIPVVVHVVYNSAVQNISDAQVLSQIEVLNEDFSMTNLDRANLRTDFNALAENTRIQFCLADTDPNGQPTNGILRVETDKTSFDDSDPWGWDGVKRESEGGSNPWPRNEYLNIWVCNLDPSAGVLGYAYPPGAGSDVDGVVINFRYFGREGVLTPPYNRGRTTTHEVGHWLGLRHIWGDGPCSVDDGIEDTPTASGPYYGCPTATATSCGSLDLWENYMDYTDDRCMVMFTAGQGTRMRAVLGGVRSSIPLSPKCYFNTGVEESPAPARSEWLLYPNPATGGLVRVELPQPLRYEAVLRITDLTGRTLWSEVQAPGLEALTLRIPELPSGMYLIQLSGQDGERVERLAVSR